MDLEKELKQIEKRFEKLTNEELEDKLIKAGLNRIKPASIYGYELQGPKSTNKIKEK